MPVIDEQQQQLEVLKTVLSDMDCYLQRWAQGCDELSGNFHEDKASSLEKLTQIMDGLSYCPKLFQSAAGLLTIDSPEEIDAIDLFNGDLARIYGEIEQATASEDYSMVADLVEYDLLPAIHGAQKLVQAIQQHYAERVV